MNKRKCIIMCWYWIFFLLILLIFSFFVFLYFDNISKFEDSKFIDVRWNLENFFNFNEWKEYKMIDDIITYSKDIHMKFFEENKRKQWINKMKEKIENNFEKVESFLKENFKREKKMNYFIEHWSINSIWFSFYETKVYLLKEEYQIQNRYNRKNNIWCFKFDSQYALEKCSLAKLMSIVFKNTDDLVEYWYTTEDFSEENLEYYKLITNEYVYRNWEYNIFLEETLKEYEQ